MRVRSVLANQWTRRGETDSLPLGQVVVKYETKFLFFLFFCFQNTFRKTK